MKKEDKEEFIKDTIKVGNSSGVLLPKRLLGSKVKVKVVKKPLHVKKEVFKILEGELEDIRGAYQIEKNPVKILAISNKTKKVIKNKIKLSIVPINKIRKDLEDRELRKKLFNSKPIINSALLKKLKKETNVKENK